MARKENIVNDMGAKALNAPAFDMVNHPSHYTAGSVECLDAIEAALGPHGFTDYLRGQVIKYQWRLALKGSAVRDAAKSEFYAKRLVQHLEAQPTDFYDE